MNKKNTLSIRPVIIFILILHFVLNERFRKLVIILKELKPRFECFPDM
jgi:hypothetical protein